MTDDDQDRTGGAWIGQQPDENTKQVRKDHDADATSVKQPTDQPPDEGKAYDPEMTDPDEANIPPESDADPTP